ARAEAIICPPDDVEALSQAMIRLASRRNPVIDNAWSGVDRFDRARCAEQLLDIFQRVTHRRAPRRSNGSRRLKPAARGIPDRVSAFGGAWSTTGLRTSE
ncbi:MAG: glycosyltransferase, partial [Planctomycetes bacterium]|nr:glycosyltransferase [Planctomycetota bacterium]